jgi:acetylornithine deacetylase/succinyl-diaminopimelate desuccinylase-like protein
MNRIDELAGNPRVRKALEGFARDLASIVEGIVAVQQIPAPTFAEDARAAYIQRQFAVVGLRDVSQDELHNVYGRLPGTAPLSQSPVIVSAHSDTVFAADTDLAISQDGAYLCGPGIGDNSTGVGGLLALARTMFAHNLTPAADVWFVSNVGEEGLGDLRGMRAVVERFGHNAIYLVVEGGLFGQISHAAIGVQRFRVEARTAGGHSWGNFGQASAVHELAHLISAVDKIAVPQAPKTTYNVGVISGGTTINSIASSASFLLDLRSEDTAELDKLVNRFMLLVREAQRRARYCGRDVEFRVEQVGSRPAGWISRQSLLVRWATQALHAMGSDEVTYVSGSTDANIPLSMGIPAVCIGLTLAANPHRLDERIDPSYLPQGLGQLLLLTLACAGGDY